MPIRRLELFQLGSIPLPAPKTFSVISAWSLMVTRHIPKFVLSNVNGIPIGKSEGVSGSFTFAGVFTLCLPTEAISPPP